VTEGWYPLYRARKLKAGRAVSVTILRQRILLFRGQDQKVRALDAFCPHFGADLGNGQVQGNEIECPLHKWRFDGGGLIVAGGTDGAACGKALLRSYPVAEHFGFIWVFSSERAQHNFPSPPALLSNDEGGMTGVFIGECDLYAHHHVLMINCIDLQHFRGVHNLDVDFSFELKPGETGVLDWLVSGVLPRKGLKSRFARLLIGNEFRYAARFAGGAVAIISYGVNQTIRGLGIPFPTLNLFWGCVPQERGVSRIRVFAVTQKRPGILGFIVSTWLLLVTVGLLLMLRREEISAFPNFRFNPRLVGANDESAMTLVRKLEALKPSLWSTAIQKEP